MNKLMKSVLALPDADWDWKALSSEQITPEFVIALKNKPWDFDMMPWKILNALPLDYLLDVGNIDHIDLTCRNIEEIICNFGKLIVLYIGDFWCSLDNYTLKFIEINPPLRECESLMTVSINDIENNPNLNWNWDSTVDLPDFTMEFYDRHNAMYSQKYLSLRCCSENIVRNPEISWDWRTVSFNTAITPEFFKCNLDKPWEAKALQNNSIFTTDMIKWAPNLPWDIRKLQTRLTNGK